MEKIAVKFDGEYPNICTGRLQIIVDGVEIYNERAKCVSTDGVWYKGSKKYLEPKMIWLDEEKYPKEIQDEVYKVISQIHVCCGGCI